MKRAPVTKLDKRNKATPKNDVMSQNCDVIVLLSIYGQFVAILFYPPPPFPPSPEKEPLKTHPD